MLCKIVWCKSAFPYYIRRYKSRFWYWGKAMALQRDRDISILLFSDVGRPQRKEGSPVPQFLVNISPQEEIRSAVKTSSAALLTAHLDIISQCWSEALSRAPIDERTKLVAFLIQLRPHFPTWQGECHSFKTMSSRSMLSCCSAFLGIHGRLFVGKWLCS